jgi:hypothetical protein
MPLSTDTYPEPINNFTEADYDEDDSSSSEEEGGAFHVWGSGSGSSASLSKMMARREKQEKRDLKRQIANRNMELKRENSVKEVPEPAAVNKSNELIKEAISHVAPNVQRPSLSRSSTGSRTDLRNQAVVDPRGSRDSVSAPKRAPESIRNSETHLAHSSSRSEIHQPMTPESYGPSSDEFSRGAPVPLPRSDSSSMYAAYQQAINPIQNLQREFLDAEPEIPDSVPAAKIIRRIGAYRNWTEPEISADLAALEINRIRTVKDIRELSTDSWKEIRELLPLVKDLLIKEVNKGRQAGWSRSGAEAARPFGISDINRAFNIQPQSNTSYAASEQSNYDLRNPRAPVSTPMDTPDFNNNRRNFQPRNFQW